MILPSLWLVQEQEGWISAEAMAYIADRIGCFASMVYEAATFYTMYNLQPKGKYHFCVCRTLSCYYLSKQAGTGRLSAARIRCQAWRSRADGQYSLEEVECLGTWDPSSGAVNGEFHENMNLEKLKELLATLK